MRERYDDGGFSGGSMERPALQRLLEDVRAAPASPSLGPGNGILRAETGGRFWAQNSENGRNSVRRPPHTSLADRNCEGFGVDPETASVCRDCMVERRGLKPMVLVT